MDQVIINYLRSLVPDFGMTALFGGPFIQDMILLCASGMIVNYIFNIINKRKQNNLYGKRREKVD